MKKFQSDYVGNPMRTHVYHEIEKAIMDGVFKPGTSLTEVRLSNELGVSRTPVREALMQLELEGLVRTVPNKGAVVVGVSDADIHDIYTIRTRIEGLAARRAAENFTHAELDAMREIVELQEFYVSKSDFAQVWMLDSRFHELLYEGCRSRPIKQMLLLFHNYIQKARESTVRSGRAAASTSEHRDIFNAILNKDPDEAERLTELHVSNARDSFFKSKQNAEEHGE